LEKGEKRKKKIKKYIFVYRYLLEVFNLQNILLDLIHDGFVAYFTCSAIKFKQANTYKQTRIISVHG
jgi:hypothetical protein